MLCSFVAWLFRAFEALCRFICRPNWSLGGRPMKIPAAAPSARPFRGLRKGQLFSGGRQCRKCRQIRRSQPRGFAHYTGSRPAPAAASWRSTAPGSRAGTTRGAAEPRTASVGCFKLLRSLPRRRCSKRDMRRMILAAAAPCRHFGHPQLLLFLLLSFCK